MKASDLFIKALENEGVEYIFGIPGEENLDMLDSLSRSKIKLILTRHEQAAGFMAATYGRLTGKAGVCLSTLGTTLSKSHRSSCMRVASMSSTSTSRRPRLTRVYFPQVEVVGDIANSIWQISEGLDKQLHWDFSRFCEIRKAGEANLLEGADDSRFPVYPQRLAGQRQFFVETSQNTNPKRKRGTRP